MRRVHPLRCESELDALQAARPTWASTSRNAFASLRAVPAARSARPLESASRRDRVLFGASIRFFAQLSIDARVHELALEHLRTAPFYVGGEKSRFRRPGRGLSNGASSGHRIFCSSEAMEGQYMIPEHHSCKDLANGAACIDCQSPDHAFFSRQMRLDFDKGLRAHGAAIVCRL